MDKEFYDLITECPWCGEQNFIHNVHVSRLDEDYEMDCYGCGRRIFFDED